MSLCYTRSSMISFIMSFITHLVWELMQNTWYPTNIAYALLLKYNIIGLNVCQGLPLLQGVVLRQIVRRNFLGQDFMEVQETNIPVIVNCNDIVKRCLKVEGRRDGKIFMTVLDTPYEHD